MLLKLLMLKKEDNIDSQEEPAPNKLKSVDTDDWLEDIVCTGETKSNPAKAIHIEIERYLASKVLEKDHTLTILELTNIFIQEFTNLPKSI